jgi:hypothetical protein
MGIVWVARRAASTSVEEVAKMTSAWSAEQEIRPPACVVSRWLDMMANDASAYRHSIAMLRPFHVSGISQP